MADLRLERDFQVTPARLFEVVTTRALLLQWWGGDQWTMVDDQLDFGQLGPWHSTLTSADGTHYKMSGQVTKVVAGQSVAFTWAWHDPQDVRGDESHVTFTVQETAKGAKLIIDHRDLPTNDSATQHTSGWESLLVRLERLVGS